MWLVVRAPSIHPVDSLSKTFNPYCFVLIGSRNYAFERTLAISVLPSKLRPRFGRIALSSFTSQSTLLKSLLIVTCSIQNISMFILFLHLTDALQTHLSIWQVLFNRLDELDWVSLYFGHKWNFSPIRPHLVVLLTITFYNEIKKRN